jgi:flagellar biosynthesis/type III secretory pathway protein FliH
VALIKNVQARKMVGSAVVMNLGDVRREAEEILLAARADAARIVGEARAEAELLVAGAEQRGHAEGMARGDAEGRVAGVESGRLQGFEAAEQSHGPRLAAIADGWDAALQAFLAGREQLREEARRDLVRLAIAIAERVVGQVPEHDPTVITGQIDGAVDMLSGATRLLVRVNPDDHAIAESHFAKPCRTIEASSGVDVVLEEDPTIVRGGCVVSAGDGEVDARLDAQMGRIVKGLFPELLDAPEPGSPPDSTSASEAGRERRP